MHQACRPQYLEFVWRNAAKTEQTVAPEPGDQFIVSRDGEVLPLRKE